MYQAHFKLDKRLFDEGIAAGTAVFRGAQHERLIEQFKVAFASASSIVLLRGPAGVGKSTLTSAALRATSTRLALAWLNSTPTSDAELLDLLLAELGVNVARTTRAERLQAWRQYQAEMAATDSRLFLVVERTEDLPVEALHTLDSLTAADAVGHPGANVVLLGHHGLEAHLSSPLLDSFRQRIRLRAELKPFTATELQDYLRHQIACAGGQLDRLFAPGTVAALHRYSQGIARLCNNLCDTALSLAASRQESLLTPQIVTEAAVQWLGLAEPAPTSANSAATPTAAATPASAAAAPAAGPVRPAPPAAVPLVPLVPPPPAATEYDGGKTDVSDIAFLNFPVLTDAVEPRPPPPAPPKPSVPATPKAATAQAPAPIAPSAPAGAQRATAASVVAARPPVTPTLPPQLPTATPKQAETAYTAPKAPAAPKAIAPLPPSGGSSPAPQPIAATPPKPVAPAALKPVAATAPKPVAPPSPAPAPTPAATPPTVAEILGEDDLERQTQTVRALSTAKSIEDVSESLAETLFDDAELDLLSAALATAADWSQSDAAPEPTTAAPTAKPTPVKPGPVSPQKPTAPPKAATPATPKSAQSDDLLDLLGLGADATLELLDDSAQAAADKQKTVGDR